MGEIHSLRLTGNVLFEQVLFEQDDNPMHGW
jgi:hypothetical protein